MKPLQKFHLNLVTPLILDSLATLPEGPCGGPRMPAMAVSIRTEERPPSGHLKFHSTVLVFVFLTAGAVGAKIPHRSVLEPEGPTRAHAKSKKLEWNLTSPLCLSIPYQYGLPKPSNVSNGPRTAPVRPGRHRGVRSVRRESDANRIMYIYDLLIPFH